MEWIVGNTFTFIVFASYGLLQPFSSLWRKNLAHDEIGAFWLSLGATFQPDYNAKGAYVNSSESAAVQASGQIEYYNTYGILPDASTTYFYDSLLTVP